MNVDMRTLSAQLTSGLSMAKAVVRGARQEVARHRGPSSPDTKGKRKRKGSEGTAAVMVVDDDAAIARLISLTLREDGYAVRSAHDGQDALGAVSTAPPDLIVLDLEMPVMNGRTFFRELRARGLDMPVLIVSAFGARAGQRELGAEAYLTKPFNPEDLREKVRGLLA